MSQKRTIIEKSRKELLVEMSKQRDPAQCEQANIPFSNDDIPKFLSHLKEARSQFKKSQLMVG